MSDFPNYPEVDNANLTKKVNELEDYIIRLERYIRYALENIDERNMTLATAKKINGAVTFTDLASDTGETVIDGGNIRTGTITGATFYTERRQLDDTIDSALGISGGEVRFYSGGEEATYDSSVAVLDVKTGQLSITSGETSAGCTIGFDGMVQVGSQTSLKLNAPAYTVTNPAVFRSAIKAASGTAATASTTTANLGNGADINLQTFTEYDPDNIFSNARYSSSYGYGIKVAKAGKYLLMASGNVATASASATAVTLALRKVTSSGTSSYLMRSQMVHASTSAYTVSIAPFVATLAANDCLSLYLSNAKTTANGITLTAIFLG